MSCQPAALTGVMKADSRSWAVVCPLALALLACQRGEQPTSGAPTASSSVRASHSSVSSAAPSRPPALPLETTAPGSPTAQANRPLGPEYRALWSWNRALNERDLTALAKLYAPKVQFYGKRLSKKQVLEAKRTALEAEPGYRQRITNLKIAQKADTFVANFAKSSGTDLDSTVRAELVFAKTQQGLQLTQETDATTEAALDIPRHLDCAGAALRTVFLHETLVADRRRVAREYPEATPGGIIHEEGPGLLEAAEGYMLPHRFDTRWWIHVDNGQLTARDAYSNQLLQFTPEHLARVALACSRR